MSSIILKAESLQKRYKNNRGAFDITFSLEQGDVCGLLGANGAGKTTIMKMITGLCSPDSGSVEVFGHDVEEQREPALRQIGALIEAPAFYSYLSAKKNLKLAARYYPELKITDQDLNYILEQVGLLQFQSERISRFSLGMKQRIGLALSMIGKPKLYVFDEPSNGLDIEGRVQIRNIINNLAKEGETSFLISSHLPEEIEKTCNLVCIVKDGRMISTAKMDEILMQYPSLEAYYLRQIGKSNLEGVQ